VHALQIADSAAFIKPAQDGAAHECSTFWRYRLAGQQCSGHLAQQPDPACSVE
jgi:hypothetical protein